jgi:hypothetical protein
VRKLPEGFSRSLSFASTKKERRVATPLFWLEIRLSYFFVDPLVEPCELELPLPDFVASLSSFFVVLWLELLLEPELLLVPGVDDLGAVVLGLLELPAPLLGAVWANVIELSPMTRAGTKRNINLFFNFSLLSKTE